RGKQFDLWDGFSLGSPITTCARQYADEHGRKDCNLIHGPPGKCAVPEPAGVTKAASRFFLALRPVSGGNGPGNPDGRQTNAWLTLLQESKNHIHFKQDEPEWFLSPIISVSAEKPAVLMRRIKIRT